MKTFEVWLSGNTFPILVEADDWTYSGAYGGGDHRASFFVWVRTDDGRRRSDVAVVAGTFLVKGRTT